MPCLNVRENFGAKNCLFVKLGKPKQDTRFDVPVFGSHTLQSVIKSGIGTVALESSHVIMLDKKRLLIEAEKNKITLLGVQK